VSEMKFAKKTLRANMIDTAAEICIDELLTIMDGTGASGSYLHSASRNCRRLITPPCCRDDCGPSRASEPRPAGVTDAFPMTDDDWRPQPSHRPERKDQHERRIVSQHARVDRNYYEISFGSIDLRRRSHQCSACFCCSVIAFAHEHTLAPPTTVESAVSHRAQGSPHFISPANMTIQVTKSDASHSDFWSSACTVAGATGEIDIRHYNMMLRSLFTSDPGKSSVLSKFRRNFQPRKTGAAHPAVPRRK